MDERDTSRADVLTTLDRSISQPERGSTKPAIDWRSLFLRNYPESGRHHSGRLATVGKFPHVN